MPGSTAASSEEQTKAKVTESSATNGIFVRPVAVAGIFRPAEESANKPLPERRRFSALSGDLRPCNTDSGAANDDFARRRQSWDVKAKEGPFGQVVLRKTPKNTNASGHASKQEPATNGSSHEDVSRIDRGSQMFEAKPAEKLSHISELPAPSDVRASNSFSNNRYDGSNAPPASVGAKSAAADSKVVNSAFKIPAPEKTASKSVASDTVDNRVSNSVDGAKQPKKVYGLIKRDSKPDTASPKADNSVGVCDPKSESVAAKIDKSPPKKESPSETSKPGNVIEQTASSVLDSSKGRIKVYGLSKTNIRKDVDESEHQVKKVVGSDIANKPAETGTVSKGSGTTVVGKPSETNSSTALETKLVDKHSEINAVSKTVNKLPEINTVSKTVNKLSEIKTIKPPETISRKPSESKDVDKSSDVSPVASKESAAASKPLDSKNVGKVNEFQKAQSPPKDFRTIRRTSDVIAAKIQNIFSNISTPEKAPFVSKKSRIQDKSGDTINPVKTLENRNSGVEKLEQTANQCGEKQMITSNKNEIKLPVDNKSLGADVKKAPNVVTKLTEHEEVNNRQSNYKGQTPSGADQSNLKKENKSALEPSDVLQSCRAGETVTTRRVKPEASLDKADSKTTEHSINAAPSKAVQDKKNLNFGGKMPIKKQDQNSLDGTTSLRATNQDDRKSSDLTAPLKTAIENSNKGSALKAETSSTCTGSGEKIFKSVTTSNSLSSSVISAVDLKNNYSVSSKIENAVSVKECITIKPAVVSQTTVKTSAVQKTGTITVSCANEISRSYASDVQKTSQKTVNSNAETPQSNQVSKIEVAKITPSTVPGAVPTINVLFRTKSPQSSATKEENRKKVVVETNSGSSPVPPAVIKASKVPGNAPSACESVQEALKTVETVQKSLNSPRLTSRHSLVNLKNEELATVTLATADSPVVETGMPPSAAKIIDKCSSIEVDDGKIESLSTAEKKDPPSGVPETNKTESAVAAASPNADSVRKRDPDAFEGSETRCKVDTKLTDPGGTPFYSDTVKKDLETDKSFACEAKLNVVDLNDWSKRFQLFEPEPPRVPVRRRTARESMPPALPVRSRFGSLKRVDDSPRYIPRSPSQSSLPQRYSYTEMLSKVCSMGVLPYTEPGLSKSCSSSSSQVSELWSELSEEQSTATHTSEMLESETTERMRLEKEIQDLQNRCSQVQLRSDKMEMEVMEARHYRTPELNGDLSEDEDGEGNNSLYKQKYERAVRDMEIMKRRIQQQHEEEIEQKAMLKKASDKRLAEALEDVEEERQVANQWKRKAQKLGSELQDLRLMLEEQMARNGELEKKQRRFDAELSAAQEEMKKERLLREKFARDKDQAMHEKYSIEQDLQSSKLDADTLHEKITQLNRELDELSLSSKGEEEVTQLKRAKQELERKSRDQEEELEELAAQVGMLEQAKLRLEMSLEKVRQEHRREASVREEEIEEIRASFSKKIKNLEAQLESEQDERHQLMKQKHEMERRLYEIADQPPPHDPEIERRLRRDLKRTKALLRDAQSMLEHTREGQSGKTLIRQLKNQLEDSEFAKGAAVKARQAVETELHDSQTQLEESTRVKNEVESRCLQLSREKSAIQTQLEEAEEEMAEVMKKYKAVVAQMSIDQKTLTEQNQQIADLETEKQMLKDQLSEVSHKFEHLAGQSEDTHKVHRLDGKVRDLESKLELEQTTRSRLEHQIARLKEQNERAREECDSLRNKELQAQEGVRRLQRQMRDLREDYSALQQKEAEAYRKQHELEMALENTETDLQVTKNDLRLACQRIQDLQNALEDDLDSGTDVPDDSGSDSDDSFELSVLRNQSVTPTQRCDSAGSNYSLASEGFRSRTSSFTHELSAFSSRNDAESKDFNGFSGMNTASRLLDVEHDETV